MNKVTGRHTEQITPLLLMIAVCYCELMCLLFMQITARVLVVLGHVIMPVLKVATTVISSEF